MKKIVSLLLVLVVMLGFAGCTLNKETTDATASTLALSPTPSTSTSLTSKIKCSSTWTKIFEIQGGENSANTKVLFGNIANLVKATRMGCDFKLVHLSDSEYEGIVSSGGANEYCTKVDASDEHFACYTALTVTNGESGVGISGKFFIVSKGTRGKEISFSYEDYINVGDSTASVYPTNNNGHFAIYMR